MPYPLDPIRAARCVLLCLAACAAGCDDGDPPATADGAPDMAQPDGSLFDGSLPDAAPPDGPPEPAAEATIEPAHGSMAGYYPVTLDLAPLAIDPAAVRAAWVGDVATYDLIPDGDRLALTVQGAPTPGPARVTLDVDGAVVDLGPIFEYDPPLDPRLARIAAIGASLGQGVQRGVPSPHGTSMSPPAQIARHLRAHMPLPMPKPGFLAQITLADVGPPPECETPDVADFIVAQATRALPTLVDPETRALDIGQAREAPDTLPYNVSAGNSRVVDVLRGPNDDLPARVLSHLVYETDTDPLGPVMRSQLDVLDEIRPDVIVSVDLYGNDLINGIIDSDDLDPEANSPLDELHADLEATLERLGSMPAEVFIGDLPRPSVLARAAFRLARAEARGELEEARERLDRIDADVAATNAKLWQLAERWPNIHVVALAERLDALEGGLILADADFDVRRFGGLVGLDGLHFTDTGYALVAEAVIDTIAATYDIELPPLDVDAVAAADTESPDALRAAGLEPLDCLR